MRQYNYPKTVRMNDDFEFVDDHNFVYDVYTGAYISPMNGEVFEIKVERISDGD